MPLRARMISLRGSPARCIVFGVVHPDGMIVLPFGPPVAYETLDLLQNSPYNHLEGRDI